MKQLVKELSELIEKMPAGYRKELNFIGDLDTKKDELYPFSSFERAFVYLLDSGVINLGKYCEMRNEYFSRNKFLNAFAHSSQKDFGTRWVKSYLEKEVPDIMKASCDFDKNYTSYHYSFILDEKIKISTRVSRAVDRYLHLPMVEKALMYDDRNSPFRINFQYFFFKRDNVDIYLLFGVWRDKIETYVMTADEIVNHSGWVQFKKSNNHGDGQLWMLQGEKHTFVHGATKNKRSEPVSSTRDSFKDFAVPANHLLDSIRFKYRNLKK